jgi:hypothetical protein
MKNAHLTFVLTLGLITVPPAFAQGGGAGAGGASTPDQSQSRGSQSGARSNTKGSVTTNDSVTDPNEKSKTGGKNRKSPKSPPNPPIANQEQPPDAHENPTAPANQPRPR